MRFIGNKENLLVFLDSIVTSLDVVTGTFCDFFSGTANVGRYFKEKGFRIISSDIMYFSYVLQYAYIKNNKIPSFNILLNQIEVKEHGFFDSPIDKVIHFLNRLDPVDGFIYQNYTDEGNDKRKYFLPYNGKKIDAIRMIIQAWYEKKVISENEYYILLATLIESVPFYANISGVYAAYLKTYDPRAIKPFKLRPIKLYESKKEHQIFNVNSLKLLPKLDVDILYLDPPYNSRQYGPNYHILETIALYDNPVVKGVTGLRNTNDKKSEFCNKDLALKTLDKIASEARYRYLLLSYNSEGIMPRELIIKTLSKYGNVELIENDYRRFKSNSNGEANHRKFIKEQVYLLTHF